MKVFKFVDGNGIWYVHDINFRQQDIKIMLTDDAEYATKAVDMAITPQQFIDLINGPKVELWNEKTNQVGEKHFAFYGVIEEGDYFITEEV